MSFITYCYYALRNKIREINEGSVFGVSMNILKMYGVYQPEVTPKSIFRELFFVSFIVVQFLLASFYRIFLVEDFSELIMAVVYVIFSVNLAIKLASFMRNQKEIVALIDEIEQLDAMVDVKILEVERANILRVVYMLLGSDFCIGFCVSLSILVLSEEKVFTIPLLYYPETDVGYSVMFVVHFLQIYGLGSIAHGKLYYGILDCGHINPENFHYLRCGIHSHHLPDEVKVPNQNAERKHQKYRRRRHRSRPNLR
jgi:hypothetical protein